VKSLPSILVEPAIAAEVAVNDYEDQTGLLPAGRAPERMEPGYIRRGDLEVRTPRTCGPDALETTSTERLRLKIELRSDLLNSRLSSEGLELPLTTLSGW
jgi:hypothetical protein